MSRVERVEIVAGEDGRETVELFVTGIGGHPATAGRPADFAHELGHHGAISLGIDEARELRAKLDAVIRQAERRHEDRSRA